MSDTNENKVHWSFWVVGAIALIWNALGVVNYFAQMNPDVLAQYRETESQHYQVRGKGHGKQACAESRGGYQKQCMGRYLDDLEQNALYECDDYRHAGKHDAGSAHH